MARHDTSPRHDLRPDVRGAGDMDLRVSDAERDAAADELRAHATAGRLELEELDRRLEHVLGSRTRREVADALRDMPATATPTSRVGGGGARGGELRAYAAVMVLLVAVWLLTGSGHPWPLYPALAWGLPLLLGGAAAARGKRAGTAAT